MERIRAFRSEIALSEEYRRYETEARPYCADDRCGPTTIAKHECTYAVVSYICACTLPYVLIERQPFDARTYTAYCTAS